MHIEQGPILEAEGCAASVVSAIAAQTRAAFTFTGKSNHAGTTPVELRQDALCAAAEAILLVEKAARDLPSLRATVGQIRIEPSASNVIPSLARISLDLRHPDDAVLATAIAALRAAIEALAARRRVEERWEVFQQSAAVPMAAPLRDQLLRSTQRFQPRAPLMVSGAGHDGVMISRACPVAMLFVRCRAGLSHHPDEYATPADIETALAILVDAVAAHAETFAA
jgi:allantoate deiminase